MGVCNCICTYFLKVSFARLARGGGRKPPRTVNRVRKSSLAADKIRSDLRRLRSGGGGGERQKKKREQKIRLAA